MKCQICGDDYYGEAGGKPLCKKHYDEAGIPQAEKRMTSKEEQIQREILQEGSYCWLIKKNYKWGIEYGISAGFKKEEVLELLKKHASKIEIFASNIHIQMMKFTDNLVTTKEVRRVQETDVKALAVEIIEKVKELVSRRGAADALYLGYTYMAVEKIIREHMNKKGDKKGDEEK